MSRQQPGGSEAGLSTCPQAQHAGAAFLASPHHHRRDALCPRLSQHLVDSLPPLAIMHRRQEIWVPRKMIHRRIKDAVFQNGIHAKDHPHESTAMDAFREDIQNAPQGLSTVHVTGLIEGVITFGIHWPILIVPGAWHHTIFQVIELAHDRQRTLDVLSRCFSHPHDAAAPPFPFSVTTHWRKPGRIRS